MPVKLAEIDRLMLEYHKYPAFTGKDSDNIYAREAQGFNEAIDQLGSRSIGINRDKLKLFLADWCIKEGLSDLPIRPLADDIIAQEKQLIEYIGGQATIQEPDNAKNADHMPNL